MVLAGVGYWKLVGVDEAVEVTHSFSGNIIIINRGWSI